MEKCKVCNKIITGKGKTGLCKSCAMKERLKNPKNNPFYGKHHTEECKEINRIKHYKGGLPHCIGCGKELVDYSGKR